MVVMCSTGTGLENSYPLDDCEHWLTVSITSVSVSAAVSFVVCDGVTW